MRESSHRAVARSGISRGLHHGLHTSVSRDTPCDKSFRPHNSYPAVRCFVSWVQNPSFSRLRGPIARASVVNELAFPSFPVSRFAFADTRAPSQRGDCRYLCRRYIRSSVHRSRVHQSRRERPPCRSVYVWPRVGREGPCCFHSGQSTILWAIPKASKPRRAHGPAQIKS